MYFLLILLATAFSQNAPLPVRTGIHQLSQGVMSSASYTIIFKAGLDDPNYNSLVSVSYVQNFNAATSFKVKSSCPTMTQTDMTCDFQSANTNSNSIVYVSYVVSDMGSLAVGTYTKTFQFGAVKTISQTLTFKPNIDSNFINGNNALFVNLYLFVSSIDSLDDDFSLNIDKKIFNVMSLDISLTVTLNELDQKNITLTFGYMLFDPQVITISLYQNQQLIPGSVPEGYIYGIASIKTFPPKRLLQAESLYKQTANTQVQLCSVDPTNIYPKIITQTTQNNQNNLNFSKQEMTPEQPSPAVALLRSALERRKVRFRPTNLNYDIYSEIMQSDGIVDTNSSIRQKLKELGFYQQSNQNFKQPFAQDIPNQNTDQRPSYQLQPSIVLPSNVNQFAPTQGLDNNLFNELFATNGFVIMTSNQDQIYFYEVDPLQKDIQPQAYYMSQVSKEQEVSCDGIKVGFEAQIDYIQKKMLIQCIKCGPGTYLDYNTKSCQSYILVKKACEDDD